MSNCVRLKRCVLMLSLGAMLLNGCRIFTPPPVMPPPTPPAANPVGHDGDLVSLPTYTIEPPDVLEVNAIKVVPKPPYRIETLDSLGVNVSGTLRDQPITGTYAVEPGGTVNLGPSYGRVKVSGLTLEEAAEAIYRQLSRVLQQPEVSVTLAASAGMQQIAGEHRVGPDGTVNLGTYGTVYVTGMTIEEAKKAIERHLSKYLDAPEVSVDVFNYASKVYYIIGQGAGLGDSCVRVQITGKETVLDAVSQIGALSRVSSKHIWIARPAPNHVGCDQILPVNWDEIVQHGSTATNYQILPGDRLYIAQDNLIALDTLVGKILSPIERIFGFTTLGIQTIETVKHPQQSINGGVN